MNLAIFASGNGSNFEAIVNGVNNGVINNVNVKILIVDHQDAYVIERAKRLNIKYKVVLLKDFSSKEEYEKHILEILKEEGINYIALAGYMKIITPVLLSAFPNRIINIHPALLPSFKGAHGIQDAFNYGCKVFGVTIHYVSSELDGGQIIAQRAFEYYGSDIEEIERKIHEIEHELYPEVINRIAKERIWEEH